MTRDGRHVVIGTLGRLGAVLMLVAGLLGPLAAQSQTPVRKYSGAPMDLDLQGADLRMVLASLADMGDDPGMMLANFRDQVEPQLRGLGVALDWHMSVLPPVSGWTSSTVLELFRLLQEATLNAARHSGTDRVRVDVLPIGGGGVRVMVSDRGRGGAVDRPGGYGLAGMRRRAALIGGQILIDSDSSGTRVILDLPRHLG